MAHTIDTKLGSASGAAAKSLGAFAKARRIVVNMLEKLVIWQERAEQRQALSELNSHMLKDIGVSSADAYREARKPFWLP
jgi:uncharacterized protein YjiS (DUF1127 family)